MDFQIGCLLLVDLQSAGFHPKVPQFEGLQLTEHESVDLQLAVDEHGVKQSGNLDL